MRADLRALGGWAAVGILALSFGLSGIALGPPDLRLAADQGGATPSGAVTEAGRAIYEAQCASCHGVAGEGTQYGPSLQGVGAASADFYLRTGRMPLSAPGQPVLRHDPRLTEEQIRLVTELVASFGEGPPIPQVRGGGDVGRGSELYIANCAACHGATGTGNAIGGGSSAANLDRATPLDIVEAMRIGPGAMPEFAFSEDDEAAIVAYVATLREGSNPGGLSLGGLGPVPEGFVAVAIGLVLLVAAAIFTARVPPEAPGSDLQPGRPGRQDRATPDDTGTAA